MHVLGRMVAAVEPGGHVLDLQVVRPDPVVEVDGSVICEIDGEPLFVSADAATAAVDGLFRRSTLSHGRARCASAAACAGSVASDGAAQTMTSEMTEFHPLQLR